MNHSSVFKHLFSLLYDIFPILGLFLTTSLFVMLSRSGEEVSAGTIWFQCLLAAEVFLYFTYSWKSGGQTLGMRAWKIAIVDHREMTWGTASLRFLTGLLSTALLGLGLWAKLWRQDKRSWMDQVSGTQVMSIKKT